MRPAHGLLLALLLVCAASLWYGLSADGDRGEQSADRTAAARNYRAGSDDPVEARVLLAVLNGSGVPRLAADVAMVVGRAGCLAGRVDNAPHDRFRRSLLINRRLPDGWAAELAVALGGVPAVREADPRAGEDAVLLLGADYAVVCRALGLDPAADR